MEPLRSTRGQSWTFDYVVSMLIFILAAILAVKILSNGLMTSDFELVEAESVRISDQLLEEGYPVLWTPSNAVRIGMSQNRRLSEAKLEQTLQLPYNNTKTLLGVKSDYAFYLEDRNGSIVSVLTQCAIGSSELQEDKNTYEYVRPSAYYYWDDTLLGGVMTSFGADFYNGKTDEVDEFYEDVADYRVVVMEDPHLDGGGSMTVSEKKKALEQFVSEGGLLFLTGNVSLNISKVAFTPTIQEDAVVIDEGGEFSLVAGRMITDNDISDDPLEAIDLGASFNVIAEYTPSGNVFMAEWAEDLGRVFYVANLDADYETPWGTLPWKDKIIEGIAGHTNITRANCTGLDFEALDSDNIARTERLAVYDSDIVKLVVLSWT